MAFQDFIREKKAEKMRIREEKREARRKKEEERKRNREDERVRRQKEQKAATSSGSATVQQVIAGNSPSRSKPFFLALPLPGCCFAKTFSALDTARVQFCPKNSCICGRCQTRKNIAYLTCRT